VNLGKDLAVCRRPSLRAAMAATDPSRIAEAHIIDFEISHETGKAGAEFFDGWIEHLQAIRLPRNEKGRLVIFAPSKRRTNGNKLQQRGSNSDHCGSRYAGIQ
jgi:hypothetical protein